MPSDKRPIQTALNQRHPEAGVHKMSHGTQAYSAPTARERLKHRMRPLPLTQLPLSEHPTSLPQAIANLLFWGAGTHCFQDLSSPKRDQTLALGNESVEL